MGYDSRHKGAGHFDPRHSGLGIGGEVGEPIEETGGVYFSRIQLNSTATSLGAYTLILNPSSLDLHYDNEKIILRTLMEGQIIQRSYLDSRPYTMQWSNIPYTLSNFRQMLAILKGYKGSLKYIHFRNAEYRLNPDWEKVRVADVETSINRGGSLTYNVVMTLIPEV